MTKLLLVEDDKSLREIYGVRLLAEGYDIVSAGDGEEALAMAIKERPQLIVSDVMMPKISGFDMLDILRSTTETKDIKVIMMTALSSEDQRARGEALGADRYLVKSQVGIEDVVRTVHDVLGDAPVARPSTSQAFGAPAAPTAAARPAAPVAPRPTPPVYTTPQSTPVPTPQQQPTPPTTPVAPAQQRPTPAPYLTPAAPVSSPLPQPTAPFSTPRPTNLGDRIIHPIAPPAGSKPDLGSLMEQELKDASPAPTISSMQPSQPVPQPIAPPVAPQSPVGQFVAPPQPVIQPSNPQSTVVPPRPVQESGISFEETPRPPMPTPPTGPFTPGPQPPIGQ
jgi:CheY-like chemotaxis protein